MKGTGLFFGEMFNFVAKLDTQESLNIYYILLFENFLLMEFLPFWCRTYSAKVCVPLVTMNEIWSLYYIICYNITILYYNGRKQTYIIRQDLENGKYMMKVSVDGTEFGFQKIIF